MRILLRGVAVLFVIIAVLLIYFVIHAMASAGGARAGVAIGYVIGAVLLTLAAIRLWRGRRGSAAGTL